MIHSRLAMIVVCALAPVVQGALITLEFSGQITNVDDSSGLLDGRVEPGTPYSGSFSFESSTPDALPDDPANGSYQFPPPGISATIGDVLLDGAASSDNSITITDTEGFDQLDLMSRHGSIPGFDLAILDADVLLTDPTGTALTNDALPLSTSDVAGLQKRFFGIRAVSSPWLGGFKISGPIDSLTIVPEPGTLLLVLTIFVASAAGRKAVAAGLRTVRSFVILE